MTTLGDIENLAGTLGADSLVSPAAIDVDSSLRLVRADGAVISKPFMPPARSSVSRSSAATLSWGAWG